MLFVSHGFRFSTKFCLLFFSLCFWINICRMMFNCSNFSIKICAWSARICVVQESRMTLRASLAISCGFMVTCSEIHFAQERGIYKRKPTQYTVTWLKAGVVYIGFMCGGNFWDKHCRQHFAAYQKLVLSTTQALVGRHPSANIIIIILIVSSNGQIW